MQRKLLIILCLMGCVLITFAQKKKKNNNETTAAKADTSINYKEVGAPMPPLRALHMQNKNGSGELYTTKDMPAKKNVLVMMYNPTCGHCQEETIDIAKHLDAFKNTEVLLLADTVMKEYIDFFHSSTKVFDYPEIKMLLDHSGFIKHTFTYTSLPQINIYNKERKLVRIFSGDTPIDSLKPYIQ